MNKEKILANSGVNLPGQQIHNLDYLISLSKGNTQFVDEMIKLFLEENPEEIDVLQRAIRESDYDLIRASAHKLKSSIYFVGLDKSIENEVSEIERLAGNRSGIIKIEYLFLKIKEMCAKVNEELRILTS